MVGKELGLRDIQSKEIRDAIAPLIADGWRIFKEGHKARLRCPCDNRCTTLPIPGTPRDAGNAAKRIKREASRCPLPADSPQRNLTGMNRD
ncbi:hypothetical protein [Kitasatospora sp. NPDC008115]|uniref:hypothetical protein n=1 Tax=Kitasatospora sp. NPDC008115 TaxID=3364022 RepID=UPI0036E0CAB8